MGQEPSTPSQRSLPPIVAAGGSSFSTQHERLIMELLPIKDAQQFREWLQGPFVRGSWAEYCRDFHSRNPRAPDVDKQRAAEDARSAINSRSVKFLTYHPEKDGWTPEDHTVRFIVVVVTDNMLKGLWSQGDWNRRGLDIAKAAYEVLSFLRTSSLTPSLSQQLPENPPGYTD